MIIHYLLTLSVCLGRMPARRERRDKRSLSMEEGRPMQQSYDAIIIGGGHNGLTCAAYLAMGGEKNGKNNLKVLVLERREKVGGAAMSEEKFPGFTYSTCYYVCSLL